MEYGECGRLTDVPLGAVILKVDGEECVGMCIECGEPILRDQYYLEDQDGIMWHERCGEEL